MVSVVVTLLSVKPCHTIQSLIIFLITAPLECFNSLTGMPSTFILTASWKDKTPTGKPPLSRMGDVMAPYIFAALCWSLSWLCFPPFPDLLVPTRLAVLAVPASTLVSIFSEAVGSSHFFSFASSCIFPSIVEDALRFFFFFLVRATGNGLSAQFEASGRGQADPVPDPPLFTLFLKLINSTSTHSSSGDTKTN